MESDKKDTPEERVKNAIQKGVAAGYQAYKSQHGPVDDAAALIRQITGEACSHLEGKGHSLADAAMKAEMQRMESDRNAAVTKLRKHQIANKKLAIETGRAKPEILEGVEDFDVFVLTPNQVSFLAYFLRDAELVEPNHEVANFDPDGTRLEELRAIFRQPKQG